MLFIKRIEALEGKIKVLEDKLQEMDARLNEGATILPNKDNKDELTPTQILSEWLNGKDGDE